MNLTSRAWRLCHLYTIKDAYARTIKFKPNSAQRHYYNRQHTCNHILKARKLGFSTFNMMDASDAMIFSPGTEVGIIDTTLPDGKKKLAMIRTAIENLDNVAIHGPDQAAIGAQIKLSLAMRASATEIHLANGSSAYCGTSLRGSTPTRLYVSELGKTAIKTPIKATEIRDGALNAVVPGNLITIESTHEGGKFGLHYDLLQIAIANDPTNLDPVSFKFHFYPWWLDDRYTLPGDAPLRPNIAEYFERIEPQRKAFCERHDFPYQPLTHGQKLWYDGKEKVQKHAIFKEFPSLPGEAFEAPGEGAIYGSYFYDLRAANRITDFHINPNRPIFTFWDIGMSDATSIWGIQSDGKDWLWFDWIEDNGKGIGHYANIIRIWELKHGQRIHTHFLPHDAAIRDRFSAKTYVQNLADMGITNVVIVPRTTDIWHGINSVRELLPNSYFHKTNCDTSRQVDGKELPSGVACLEGYHKRVSNDGITIQDTPVHDVFSHTADAARTFGDAHRLGLIDANLRPLTQKPTILRPTIRR